MSYDVYLEAPAQPTRSEAVAKVLAPLLDEAVLSLPWRMDEVPENVRIGYTSGMTLYSDIESARGVARAAWQALVTDQLLDALEAAGVEKVRDEPTELHWSNYTSNMSPMWREAGIDLADYDRRRASDLAQALEPVLVTLRADPQRWSTYDSPNGWGSYATALEWLEGLAEACREHPDATVRVDC